MINTNYALQANLHPARDAIAIESRLNNPYGNVIAAYQSDEMRRFILRQFDGAISPVF